MLSRTVPASLALLALAAAACARMEPPPGGPPDNSPPVLLATRPESLAVIPGFDGAVEFTFDEVITEGSQPSMGLGTSELERLIMLSPSDNVPRVRWKRQVLAVEPKEGWRPDRVYRVELLPGVADLQRNRLDSGTVVTFTTGAPAPTVTLTGQVVDWGTGRMARQALVEAVLLPDSLGYRTVSDSGGRFTMGPLPRGDYLVYGVIDQNRNSRRDLRDNYDTTRVRADSTVAVAPLWAFPRDTVGPRLQALTAPDSMTVDLAFNQMLDPYQAVDTGNIRIRLLPDSTAIPVLSLRSRAADDSLQRAARAAADTSRQVDTTRAALDSARRVAEERLKQAAPGDVPESDRTLLGSRPPLYDHLIARTGVPLAPGRQYLVEVLAARNVNGVAAESRLSFRVPERPPAPAPADSAPAIPADSVRPDPTPPPGP